MAPDTESERLEQEALERLMERHTTLVVPHHPSMIQREDRILVLDKSLFVGKGAHAELLE